MKSLTKPELDKLIAVATRHSERDALMLSVIFNHGLRISEALSLNRDNIVGGHLVIQRLKGSKKTNQPLLPNEKTALEALAKDAAPFFQMHRATAWRRIQAYGSEAGIPAFKLHPHALKHSTGRLAYEGGMGIPELQSYLGHVCGSNTMIYLQATEEQAAHAFAAAIGDKR